MRALVVGDKQEWPVADGHSRESSRLSLVRRTCETVVVRRPSSRSRKPYPLSAPPAKVTTRPECMAPTPLPGKRKGDPAIGMPDAIGKSRV